MRILSLLKTEAKNPRQIAKILGKHETHVSSKLKLMQQLGLVKGTWVRKDDRNVKLYELIADSIQLSLTPEGYEVKFGPSPEPVTIPLFHEAGIPSCPNFVGRRKELVLLKSAGNLVVIQGIAGIGKTWLAARFVSQLPSKEVFWHTIKGFDTFDSIVRKLAVYLRLQGKTELYDYVRSKSPDKSLKLDLLGKEIDDRRNILVFDDYQLGIDRDIEDLISDLKNRLSKACIVIISRIRPRFTTSSGVTEFLLPGLTLEETKSFLSTRGIKPTNALLNLIQEKLHGHPLSLEFLCEASKGTDIESALESVSESKIVDYLWTQIYENLSESECRLLAIMSAFRAAVSIDALRFVCGAKLSLSLYTLERRHLLAAVGRRYLLHDLVREMAYQLLERPEHTHKKIADYYLKEGSIASHAEAVYHLLQAKEYESIAKIVQGQYRQDDPVLLSEYAEPYMELLKKIPQDSISRKRRAYVLAMIGRIEQGIPLTTDPKRFARTLHQALQLAEEQKDLDLTAKISTGLGMAYYETGPREKAEEYLLTAADYFQRLGRDLEVSRTCQSLACVYWKSGLMNKALRLAHRSLEAARSASPGTDSLRGLAGVHGIFGALYATMGKFKKAIHHHKESLKINEQFNLPEAVAVNYYNLASTYEDQGKLKDALAICEKNIELCRTKSFRELLAFARNQHARLLLKSGKEGEAGEELKELVRMCRTLKGRRVRGFVEMSLGMFHSHTKNWGEAVKHYRSALELLSRYVDESGEAYQEFAKMWLEKGDHERFKSHAKKAIKLLRNVGAEHRVRQLEGLLSKVQVDTTMARVTAAPIRARLTN